MHPSFRIRARRRFPFRSLPYAAPDRLVRSPAFPASGLQAGHAIGWFGRPGRCSPCFFWKWSESCGLRMAAKGDALTHSVIGYLPYPECAAITPSPGVLDQSILEFYLAREEARYLQTEENPEQADRLQRMLRSRDTSFLRLAISFIQGGGLPRRLRTDLFLAWKLCPDPGLRAELRRLLRQHLPFEIRKPSADPSPCIWRWIPPRCAAKWTG